RELIQPVTDKAEKVEKELRRLLNNSETTGEFFEYAKQQAEFSKELNGTKAELDALHGTIEDCRARITEKERLKNNLSTRAQDLARGLPIERRNLAYLEEALVATIRENEMRLQGATENIERKKQNIAIFSQELFDISGETLQN
ncbi:MAG: hypothetical protein NTX88_10890, partial [Candidatus Atribacteria bacterium]|nr:hypothetical protein [Candidatus Atribacteria bacterium]